MEGRRFCPGDIVQISGGLSVLEDISRTYGEYAAIGSIFFRNKIGIIVGNTQNGYNVDFGICTNGSVSIPEKWLVRA